MGSLSHTDRALAAALVATCATAPASAQFRSTWLVGAGVSLPAAEFASYASPGWTSLGGWERRLGHLPVAIRVDASYGANTDSTDIGFHERTTLLTGMANLVYHFDGAKPHLYALAGIGYFRHHFSSDDPAEVQETISQLGVQLGEGVTFTVGSMALFIEGRLVTSFGPDRLQYFPLLAGVRLGRSTR